MNERLLLSAGWLAAVIYVGVDIGLAMLFGNYSFFAQTISEYSALGSSTRLLAVPLFLSHSMLQLVFGVEVWRVAGADRSLQRAGLVLAGIGILDLAAPLVPMNVRGVTPSLTDVLHIGVTMVTALLIVLAMWVTRNLRGPAFRMYCLISIAAVLGFGNWTGMYASSIAADLPTPWVGLIERACIYSYMAWMAVFSLMLSVSHTRPQLTRQAPRQAA